MKALRLWQDFRDYAVGGYFVGPSYVAWCPAPDFMGLSMFGRMSEAETQQALALWQEPAPGGVAENFDFFLDGTSAQPSGPAAYAVLHEWFTSHGGAIARGARRQVVTMPVGSCSAVFAGLLSLTGDRVPWTIVHERDQALAWLNRPELAAAAEISERAGQDIIEHSPVVARLRALVSASSGSRLSIATAGRQLGMAPRSLQRHLRAAGTGFREELERARQSG